MRLVICKDGKLSIFCNREKRFRHSFVRYKILSSVIETEGSFHESIFFVGTSDDKRLTSTEGFSTFNFRIKGYITIIFHPGYPPLIQ